MDNDKEHTSRKANIEPSLEAGVGEATQIDTTPEISAQLSMPRRLSFEKVLQYFAQSRPELELIDQVGEGTSGIVLRATDKRLERTVAVKVLHRDWVDSLGVDSLTREAQAAAFSDDHIVRVYELSPLNQTLSYIIMEWIGGPSLRDCLTQFSAFPALEAARLCRQVAMGLSAAHARGIVHGDIKPANILLEPIANQPLRPGDIESVLKGLSSIRELNQHRAKLTDFGLARRVDGGQLDSESISGSDEQGSSRLAGFVGTPAYASPEQLLRGQPANQLTDIWTLGATLYHLLCGVPPYSGRPFAIVSRMEVADPIAPRQVDPRIPRDLESICMKALARTPSRRYHNAQQMADDLQRFLQGEPVVARPVSSLVRMVRWVKRKPLISALATSLVLALVSGSVISNYYRARAEKNLALANSSLAQASEERDNAIAVTSLLKGMISSSDAHHGDPNTKVIDALAGLESRIPQVLKDKPRIEAEVRSNLGAMYFSIAAYQQAHDQFEKAIALRGSNDPLSQVEDRISLANSNRWLYKPNEAFEQAKQAYQEAVSLLGASDPTTLYALEVLAGCYKDNGQLAEAEKIYLRALELSQGELAMLTTLSGLATIYLDSGRYAEAEEFCRKVIHLRERAGINDTREGIVIQSNLGIALSEQGKISQAIEQQRDCSIRARRILGVAHDLTVSAWLNYAETLRRSGDSAGSLAISREFMDICANALGPMHPVTLDATESVILGYVRRKESDKALEVSQAAMRLAEAKLPEDSDWRYRLLNCHGAVLMGMGRAAEAVEYFQRAVNHYQENQPNDNRMLLTYRNNLGLALIESNNSLEAIPIYEQIIAQASADGESFLSRSMQRNYGLALIRSGKLDQGRQLLEKTRTSSIEHGEVDNAQKCQEYLDEIAVDKPR